MFLELVFHIFLRNNYTYTYYMHMLYIDYKHSLYVSRIHGCLYATALLEITKFLRILYNIFLIQNYA